jgi:hypothetical protein
MPDAPKTYATCTYHGVESVLQKMIETCADFYHRYDLNKDALRIAKLVVCDETEDEPTAAKILQSMGYLTWLMTDWRGLTPETTAKLKQIRNLVFPDLVGSEYFEDED